MKIKKIFIYLVIIIFICISLGWALFNTSFGNNLIKSYFQHKISNYFPDMKIDKFKIIDYNNFFMSLCQNENHYKLYGKLYPLDAIIEGSIKEIKIANKKIKDNMTLKGHISENNGYLIDSIVYFDNNVGYLDVKLNKNKKINFQTENVDLNYFIKHINNAFLIKVNNLKAKVDLNISNNDNNGYLVKSFIKGFYRNLPFNLHINFNFYPSEFIVFEGIVNSDILNGKFKGVYNHHKFIYDADFDKFDLSLLNLLYPFNGKVYLKIRHDKSEIIKFYSKDFKGFKDKNINIEFNMPVKDFFTYLNIYNIFKKGDIEGRIIIANEGTFNFIIQNAALKEYLAKKLKLRNNFFKKIFVKGNFDTHKIVFNLLSDNKNNVTINIRNGKILIYPKINATFIIIVNNNKEEDYYKFNKNKLFLLKKRFLVDNNSEILVF